MLVTDLDGTLLDDAGSIGRDNQQALELLGRRGIARVVATGRSPYSFYKAVPADLPIDYAVLSSGAGIIDWPRRTPLRRSTLNQRDISRAARVLLELGTDFMIHHPFPDNHPFLYSRVSQDNEDFERRIRLYATHAEPLTAEVETIESATQLIAIVRGARGLKTLSEVRRRLPDLSVLRTTSPLDHTSTWIEVFPEGVTKASASAWLTECLDVPRERVLGVGNDYNDLDLLMWAGTARVVQNAPDELRATFTATAANNEGGVAKAVQSWLGSLD